MYALGWKMWLCLVSIFVIKIIFMVCNLVRVVQSRCLAFWNYEPLRDVNNNMSIDFYDQISYIGCDA